MSVMVRKILFICLAALVAFSCDKEDRKNTYASQEAVIDRYVSSLSSDYTVVLNQGVPRVIVDQAPSGAAELEKGDSLYIHYSGYVFSNGKGSLFATNETEVARDNGFVTDGKPYGIKFGSSALIKGLALGLEGIREGEHCYIIFSARYGYGNQQMGSIPEMTPLFFEITADKIVK